MSFKKICIAYNLYRKEGVQLALTCEKELQLIGVNSFKVPIGYLEPFMLSEGELRSIDLCIVLGGDGTLLGAARRFSEYGIPLLGINAGHLGFLSEADAPGEFRPFLEEILAGHYKIDTRTMLHGEIQKQKPSEENNLLLALNDIVIARSSRSHVLQVNLSVDDLPVTQYGGDGLIVCTPTGSTAYFLAAGGSVLAPNIAGIGVAPICPHSLTSRPLIISDDSELRIQVKPRSRGQSLITVQADGQETFLLEPEDQVLIKKSNTITKLLRSLNPANRFYHVLSKKLLWGQSSQ
ncbi:MAG: NAD(+)/NADH kinase [Candidatus Caenarcaniphilales bacterium]|nr:NAD(+)/NADH kinase [Candidatus Caenarcaniphilales bacterium]